MLSFHRQILWLQFCPQILKKIYTWLETVPLLNPLKGEEWGYKSNYSVQGSTQLHLIPAVFFAILLLSRVFQPVSEVKDWVLIITGNEEETKIENSFHPLIDSGNLPLELQPTHPLRSSLPYLFPFIFSSWLISPYLQCLRHHFNRLMLHMHVILGHHPKCNCTTQLSSPTLIPILLFTSFL